MARERRLDREIFFTRVVLPEQGAHARAQGGGAGFSRGWFGHIRDMAGLQEFTESAAQDIFRHAPSVEGRHAEIKWEME